MVLRCITIYKFNLGSIISWLTNEYYSDIIYL